MDIAINSFEDAEFDGLGVADGEPDGFGAGVAEAARVAIRKPFETLMGTTVIDLAVGPVIFFPVVALKTLLSFGHVTCEDFMFEVERLVASWGQVAIRPEYFEVVDRKTKIRLPANEKSLEAPTLMSEALPRLMSLA